jgi:Flp pilus assembly protein TadD
VAPTKHKKNSPIRIDVSEAVILAQTMMSRFSVIAGQAPTAVQVHFLCARQGRKLCFEFGWVTLAIWLFLPGSAGSTGAQSSQGAEHAAHAAELVQAGNLKGAEAEMRRAVERSPREAQYHAQLGVILGMLRRPEEASKCFESALVLEPTNLAVRRNLAATQWQMGRLASARENLELILKTDPGDSQALLLLGTVLIDAGRYAPALAVAQRAAEAMPSSYRAHAVKGMAEMRLQRYTDSAKSYARAAELSPTAPEVNVGLAMSLWASGKVLESFAAFEQGLKRFPEDAYHCLEYGRLLLKSAKPNDSTAESQAVALLKTALKLSPSLSEAHYLLGDLALRKGNSEEALQHLERAVKLDPGSSKIHFALSRTYRRLGRMEDAAREEGVFQTLKAREEAAPAAPLLGGGPD